MRKRRKFSSEFKAEQVLATLTGSKTAAEICREHDLKPLLLSDWKAELLEKAPLLFQSEEQRSQESARISELEHLVGRLTLQLNIAKKSLCAFAPRATVKRTLIQKLAAHYPIRWICEVLDYARSSFDRQPSQPDEQALSNALQAWRWNSQSVATVDSPSSFAGGLAASTPNGCGN